MGDVTLYIVKNIGKQGAGKPHARFDEGGQPAAALYSIQWHGGAERDAVVNAHLDGIDKQPMAA